MSKIKLYPKFCEAENCNKGICEGWTNEHINLCDSCFNKEEDWKQDAAEEWSKFEKDNSYNPNTYRTAWNVEELDWVFNEEGDWIDL
jgi:hypothetical protein